MRINNLLIAAAAALIGVLPLSQAGAANGPVVVGNVTINIVDPIPSLGLIPGTVNSFPARLASLQCPPG